MCSEPVTFGGGITTQKAGCSALDVPGLGAHQAAGFPRLVQAVLYLTRQVLRWELGSLLAQICTHDSRV